MYFLRLLCNVYTGGQIHVCFCVFAFNSELNSLHVAWDIEKLVRVQLSNLVPPQACPESYHLD